MGLGCNGSEGESNSDSGTMSTTVATSTEGSTETSAGSNSDSDTGTSDGGSASNGQTNTTDLSGSDSNSQGGSATSDGSTGDDSVSGGGSSTSTSTSTSTGDVVPCGDYQDLESCEEDPSCQGVVALEFINNISAWCLGEPVFLGCIDGDLECAGEAQAVCVGNTKHLLEGSCLPEGVAACDPPAGGPNWKFC